MEKTDFIMIDKHTFMEQCGEEMQRMEKAGNVDLPAPVLLLFAMFCASLTHRLFDKKEEKADETVDRP